MLSWNSCENFQLAGRLVTGHSSTARCICTDPHVSFPSFQCCIHSVLCSFWLQSGVIVTGGEDGFVCLWCPSSTDSEAVIPRPSHSLKVIDSEQGALCLV